MKLFFQLCFAILYCTVETYQLLSNLLTSYQILSTLINSYPIQRQQNFQIKTKDMPRRKTGERLSRRVLECLQTRSAMR